MKDRDAKGKFQKGNTLGKGNTPPNKIQDEFSELDISRQLKYYRRKKAKKL